MLINLLILTVVGIILYFIISYYMIKNKENSVGKVRDEIFEITDKRFSIFQKMLEEFKNPADYELTFLNEIIKIRSQSQKYINENRYKESINNEFKINKVIDSIDNLFKETPQFEIISEEKKKDFSNSLKNLNKEIEEKTKHYNMLVEEYNKTKVNSLFGLFLVIFGRSFKKADLFTLK